MRDGAVVSIILIFATAYIFTLHFIGVPVRWILFVLFMPAGMMGLVAYVVGSK